MRIPTKADSIWQLRSLGIKTVIDVGVAQSTESLMQVFPDAHHILIESDAMWIDSYPKTYSGISHEVRKWTANDSTHRIDSIDCEGPILLKIDVDGSELTVLDGCTRILPNVAAVVVEATMDRLSSIAGMLDQQGFAFFDIVDLCYCGGQLHQCDLVLVNRSVEHLVIVPFDLAKYQDSSLTCHLTRRLSK